MSNIFKTVNIKNLELQNRIVLPPMCMYSATDGLANKIHEVHYAARALGRVGLVIVEATAVSPEGRITDNDLGLWTDGQAQALSKVVCAAHEVGGKIGIQISHSGRKGTVTGFEPEGPSAIAYDESAAVPKEMSKEDIKDTVKEFGQAVKRAADIGFDIVEIHLAHGYLLGEFLSPLTNVRTDEYGGSKEKRAQIVIEIIEEVSKYWPKERPLAVRISADDFADGGNTPEDLADIVNLIKDEGNGIDLIDVSAGGLLPIRPKVFPGYQLPYARIIKEKTGLPVIGGGQLVTFDEVSDALSDGVIDMIYLGREIVRNPNWVLYAAQEEQQRDIDWPMQYERAFPLDKGSWWMRLPAEIKK